MASSVLACYKGEKGEKNHFHRSCKSIPNFPTVTPPAFFLASYHRSSAGKDFNSVNNCYREYLSDPCQPLLLHIRRIPSLFSGTRFFPRL